MKFLNLFVSQFREFYRAKIYIYQYAESTFDKNKPQYYLVKDSFLSVSLWQTDIQSVKKDSFGSPKELTVRSSYDTIQEVFKAISDYRNIYNIEKSKLTKVNLMYLMGAYINNSHWRMIASANPLKNKFRLGKNLNFKLEYTGGSLEDFINTHAEYFV